MFFSKIDSWVDRHVHHRDEAPIMPAAPPVVRQARTCCWCKNALDQTNVLFSAGDSQICANDPVRGYEQCRFVTISDASGCSFAEVGRGPAAPGSSRKGIACEVVSRFYTENGNRMEIKPSHIDETVCRPELAKIMRRANEEIVWAEEETRFIEAEAKAARSWASDPEPSSVDGSHPKEAPKPTGDVVQDLKLPVAH